MTTIFETSLRNLLTSIYRLRFFLLYIAAIYFVNWGFSFVPPVDLGFGSFSPMAIVVGAIFVIRDYAQRSVGHWVLLAMVIGCIISYLMADPFVAIASAASFCISELVDWLNYTLLKKPFYERVLISSIIATPVDTAVFLFLIDLAEPLTFVMMVVCKLVAAFAIYFYGTRKNKLIQGNT